MRTRRPPAAPAARSHAARGRANPPAVSAGVRHGLARVLSKAGVCSRSEAARWIADGRVRVAGRIVRDPEFPIASPAPPIEVDGQPMGAPQRLYVMLNKPRGVVTTVQDERGRDTVYRCFDGAGLPWIAPVGRLDKASEGLLLFSNDPQWAAHLTDPQTGPHKTYHVQVDRLPDEGTLAALRAGVEDEGEFLLALAVRVLRSGDKTAWLEVVLDEGRNRHIRRLLAAFDLQVLRLVRVAIGELTLGDLGKGQWRALEVSDQQRLGAAAPG
ncbi:pseudouridine synthase [Stenotrophomonas indicatrix]|uniref:pseudouridine synthase n=1 Tax=Stenotrophomonas indicatrix TaxID=2045451 RepID=UPI00215B1D4B|nr:rRNA pseudouridine synthase [Stenotrophomonas indicatrix]MCR8716595.1 rRNA pseudouridine synthase [Stenotrophomonas indicatrix]